MRTFHYYEAPDTFTILTRVSIGAFVLVVALTLLFRWATR